MFPVMSTTASIFCHFLAIKRTDEELCNDTTTFHFHLLARNHLFGASLFPSFFLQWRPFQVLLILSMLCCYSFLSSALPAAVQLKHEITWLVANLIHGKSLHPSLILSITGLKSPDFSLAIHQVKIKIANFNWKQIFTHDFFFLLLFTVFLIICSLEIRRIKRLSFTSDKERLHYLQHIKSDCSSQ